MAFPATGLMIGRRMSFGELTPKNLARAHADALESSHVSHVVNLPVNGMDVTVEVILKFS